MNKPTGKLAHAYSTIRNMEAIIEQQKGELELLRGQVPSDEFIQANVDSIMRHCEGYGQPARGFIELVLKSKPTPKPAESNND